MSKDSSCGGCQQRYKGIENFLRRVAFNLGNTPSETEVKIISCIPIDVTDLQLKIAELEKQLEQACASKTYSPDKLSLTIKSPSTKKQSSNPPLTKKRSSSSYLGDDVISVSPPSNNKPASIKSKKQAKDKLPTSFVTNQVLYANSGSCDNSECITSAGKHSSVSIRFDRSPALRQTRKSVISVLYPTSPGQNCNIVAQLSDKSTNDKQDKLKDPKKSFFHKKKSRTTKKKHCKTELVYYATPETKTPFNNFFADDATSKNAHREVHGDCNDEDVYFSHILNKQYMPRPALNDLSNTSEFSSPVCRDNVQCRATSPYESDVCSCCHGPFQNLDQDMGPAHRFDLYPTFTDKENDNKYAYYDSSAYDVIPVKENSYKSAEDFDVLNRRDFRRHNIDMKCWPESVRPKKVQHSIPKFGSKGRRNQRVIVNYHTVAPIRNNLNMKSNKRNTKKDIVLNNMAEKRPIMTHSLNLNRNTQDSNICEIEFGEVYAKQNRRQKIFPKPVILHNASCSTTILNNSECQTGMETNESLVEDKTAATLNQIKTILQSVLTEVKTKGKLTSNSEPKKDAVVQNDPSQSNIIGGSHLLNSFTYSHYNTNPYIASCSRQMPPNNYCPPNVPYSGAKCIQQYPLFVQPNRQLCSTCDKNNHVAKQPPAMGSMKPAFTTAAGTNTDQTRDRSKETQKLIKEIYNSIALNIETPTRETALNQGDQIKKLKTDNDNEINQRSNLISEIFKNPNPLNTSVTEKMTPVSKLTSDDTTFRSGYKNRAPLPNKRTVSNDHSVDSTTTTGDTEPDRVEVYREGDSDDQSDDTPVNEDDATDATDSSTTDDDTDKHGPTADELGSKKQERKGILSKMFKLFTPRNRRQTKKSIKEQNDESDSDDYQTIYSQKVSARPKREVRKVQEVRKVHHPLPTKVIHSKHQRMKQRSPERFRRAPYMEQEYRRYWDEKLLFQDRYAKHSTEASRMTTPQAMPRPVYYQNYEARSVLVEPNRRMVANTHRNPAKSSYVTNRPTANRPRVAPKGLAWLKKHKMGIHCGEQWKKLILEG